MWELDCKESWAPKNWCFWTTVVLGKTLESPLDFKEIQPVNPKGNQFWIVIGRTYDEAETLILWPPEVKNSLLEKTLVLGKNEAGGEGDDRGWDDWMASPTQWTWVWVNSESRWWTGRPGVLWSMGSQSLTRLSDWTELNWNAWRAQRQKNPSLTSQDMCVWYQKQKEEREEPSGQNWGWRLNLVNMEGETEN